MSNRLLNLAWKARTSKSAKSVLTYLADQVREKNVKVHGDRCWPSIPTIAHDTCMDSRSVTRAIAELEAATHITVDRSNGRHSKYLVHPQPPSGCHGFTSSDPGHSDVQPLSDCPPNRVEQVMNRKTQPPPEGETAVVAVDSPSAVEPRTRQPMPPDFVSSPAVRAWCNEQGFEDPDLHLSTFIRWARKAAAQAYDWDDSFKEAIAENRAKVERRQRVDVQALVSWYANEQREQEEAARREERRLEREAQRRPFVEAHPEFERVSRHNFKEAAEAERRFNAARKAR